MYILKAKFRRLRYNISRIINKQSSRGLLDWINMLLSSFGVFVSIIAIIIAIQVPKQIAEEQNKIALFEKRYKVYHEVKIMNDFLNGYFETYPTAVYNLPIRNPNLEERKAFYYKSLWEGEIQKSQYSMNDDIGTILRQQEQLIDSMSLVFNISSDEEDLCNNFYNNYRAMTQRYVFLDKADFYISIREFDNKYDQFDLTELLEKIRVQVKLYNN